MYRYVLETQLHFTISLIEIVSMLGIQNWYISYFNCICQLLGEKRQGSFKIVFIKYIKN